MKPKKNRTNDQQDQAQRVDAQGPPRAHRSAPQHPGEHHERADGHSGDQQVLAERVALLGAVEPKVQGGPEACAADQEEQRADGVQDEAQRARVGGAELHFWVLWFCGFVEDER